MKLSTWLAAAVLATAVTAHAQTSQTYRFDEGQTTPHAQAPHHSHHAKHHAKHPTRHPPKRSHKKTKKPGRHAPPRYVSHRSRNRQA
jgi:hypothetical protein